MLRSIDLDKLAATVPAITRLIGAWSTSRSICPDSSFHHHPSQRFACYLDVMPLGEILRSQRRPEVMVMLPNQGNDLISKTRIVPPVARLTALARNKSFSAAGS
ncbi:hypothetical protein WP12_04095 [Sphingomonas sp. SRS2]|nr:hypothetical protein WP12_04095 [Sphingomonas sp. SRS2]